VAAADHKGGKVLAGETPDYFEKLLKKTYTNHVYPVKHLFKDCGLMKKWLAGPSKKGEQKKKAESGSGGAGEKQDDFIELDGCLMIFGGPATCKSKRKQRCLRPNPRRPCI